MGESLYNITPEILERSLVVGEPQSITEWLDSLSESDREDWYLVANRDREQNSSMEFTQCMFTALALLSYELDTLELSIGEDKIKQIVGKFLTSIIIHKGMQEGLYVLLEGEKLSLATNASIQLTEKGTKVAEELFKSKAEEVYGKNRS